MLSVIKILMFMNRFHQHRNIMTFNERKWGVKLPMSLLHIYVQIHMHACVFIYTCEEREETPPILTAVVTEHLN